jgi:hypothetical protein
LHLYKKAYASHAEVQDFGKGLKAHGWHVYSGETAQFNGADLVVQWGARVDPPPSDEVCTLDTSYI